MPYGERIRSLREHANLSQAKLGIKLGVSSQAVSKWETNKAEPDSDILRELCNIFNVTSDEILGILARGDNDNDIWDLRESLRRDPERRMLFDAARNVSKEDIQTAVRILDALKGTDKHGTD
jgi:transcriptional regulator with XRE-family HTH domain